MAKVTVEELQGNWQKLFSILAWKFGRDGFTIRLKELIDLPMDRVLLLEGHSDTIEFRWVTIEEATRISEQERDRHGVDISDLKRKPLILIPKRGPK